MVGSDSQYEKVCENTCAGKLEKEVSITEVVFSSYWFPGGLLGIERGKGGCDVINEISGSLVMFFIGVAMDSKFFLLNSYNSCYLD